MTKFGRVRVRESLPKWVNRHPHSQASLPVPKSPISMECRQQEREAKEHQLEELRLNKEEEKIQS